MSPFNFNHLIDILVKVKTIAVDFVNDEETSYRLKIAREIEGIVIKLKKHHKCCPIMCLRIKLMLHEIWCNYFVLGLEIAVLVNNVGLSYEFPAPFLEIEGGTNEFTADLVKCNITSVNTMTALVLPQVKNSLIFH